MRIIELASQCICGGERCLCVLDDDIPRLAIRNLRRSKRPVGAHPLLQPLNGLVVAPEHDQHTTKSQIDCLPAGCEWVETSSAFQQWDCVLRSAPATITVRAFDELGGNASSTRIDVEQLSEGRDRLF